MAHNIKPGLQLAMKLQAIFSYAKKRICTSSCKRNRIKHYKRVLETAAKFAPVIISFQMVEHNLTQEKDFNAGEKQQSAGGIAEQNIFHTFGRSLQTTVILHTDHCAKNCYLVDGLLDASEKHFAETGKCCFLHT
jgi:fructose-bisphosphate aldolase class II